MLLVKRSSFLLLSIVCLACLFAVGCGGSDDDDVAPDGDVTEDGDVSEDGDSQDTDGDSDNQGEEPEDVDPPELVAHTTLAVRLEPTVNDMGGECEDNDADYCSNPALSNPDLSVFEDAGFGFWEESNGEDFRLEALPGASSSGDGQRRSLFVWAHLSDIHITDEESPNRLAAFDTPGIPSALRPMDMYSEIVLDAAMQTINYFNFLQPINLVLFSGDLTDNAQLNEASNFMDVVKGETVDPDSGADDDPVEGLDNDPQDPFDAEGLQGIPWIVALGNHDELILGNWEITEANKGAGMGSDAAGGTRDGQSFEVVSGEVVADSDREPLTHEEMIRLFAEDPAAPESHGLTQDNILENRGYYVYDPPGDSILRFIVLDSAYRPNGYNEDLMTFVSAVIDRDQHDNFLVPELQKAASDKKLVVVSMHHGSSKLQDDGLPEEFVSTETFRSTLAANPHVLALCIGHSHENTLHLHPNADDTGGFFEIQSSSLIDWPQQFRFYELADNGDGTLSLFTVVVDHAGLPDSMSETSRRYSLIDVQAAWGEGGPGVSEERNIEMLFNIPEGYEDAVQNAAGEEQLQATTTWLQ